MKKSSKFFLLGLLGLLFSGVLPVYAQIKNPVTINVSVKNNTFTTASLFHVSKDVTLISSSPVSAGSKFTFVCDVSKPDLYKIQFDNNNFIMMALQPGEKVEFSLDANDLIKQIAVSGSKATADIYKNQQLITATKIKLDSINNLSYREMTNPKIDSLRNLYAAAYDKIRINQENKLKSYILENSTSLAILFLLEAMPVDANYETYSKIDSVLFVSHPDNFYVENFHNQMIANKATAIGAVAPDFILPDTSGVNISMSSLRGKYVLLDFWASWCGPCKKELPSMVKLYSDFKKKGFEILGVSLDKARDKWVSTIKSENMTWTQVSDLKFWQSEVAALYSVKAIPYTILLDKEGKIIAKNLRGEKLYRKVESVLK